MKNNEIEMRISDLFAMLLKAFKPILCLTLILGFLGGVYGAYAVAKAKPRVTWEDVEAAEQKLENAESDLSLAQSALVFRNEVELPIAREKTERTKLIILQFQDYLKNSIYYSMNPFRHGVARLRFTVDTEGSAHMNDVMEDYRAGIVSAYTQLCPYDTKTIEQICAIMDVEASAQYIEELISITDNDDHNVVEISVYCDELSAAEEVVNYLYDMVTARAVELLPKHRITVLTTYSGYETDWDLFEKHAQIENSLKDAEAMLLTANASLESLQNRKTEETAVTSAAQALSEAQRDLQITRYSYSKNRPSLRNMAKHAIKLSLISTVVGLLFGCCFTLLKGLLGGIIQNQDEVMNRYTFPLIGILPRTKKVWFDKTIRKLEGEPIGDVEEITQATVQSLLSRIGERSACLISTGSNATARKLSVLVGDKVKVLDSIMNNGNAIMELANYDGIVLVEERGISRLNAVDAEVNRAKALEIEILGIVLA